MPNNLNALNAAMTQRMLDAEIARRVFNCEVKHFVGMMTCQCAPKHPHAHDSERIELAYYSSDHNKANLVVQWMRQQGWDVEILHNASNERLPEVRVIARKWEGSQEGAREMTYSDRSHTAPEAICRVALQIATVYHAQPARDSGEPKA